MNNNLTTDELGLKLSKLLKDNDLKTISFSIPPVHDHNTGYNDLTLHDYLVDIVNMMEAHIEEVKNGVVNNNNGERY